MALTFKILFSACRRLFIQTWYLLSVQYHECCCKNHRVYVLSLCFQIHKGPESTIDMTFWVSNFSVEVCLYREEKKLLPFFVKALQELSKLYWLLVLWGKSFWFGLVWLFLNCKNSMQFEGEIRTAEHCCISPLLTADCFRLD